MSPREKAKRRGGELCRALFLWDMVFLTCYQLQVEAGQGCSTVEQGAAQQGGSTAQSIKLWQELSGDRQKWAVQTYPLIQTSL
jgi:hypothetical protein